MGFGFFGGAVVFISEFFAGAESLWDVILRAPDKKAHFSFLTIHSIIALSTHDNYIFGINI